MDSTSLYKKLKFSKKRCAKNFFGPNREDWGAYLGKSAKIYEEKIKNKNLHETVNRSPEIVKRPPEAQGRGWGGFFGLRGPWHNALRLFLRNFFLPNIQSVWFLESHTLKYRRLTEVWVGLTEPQRQKLWSFNNFLWPNGKRYYHGTGFIWKLWYCTNHAEFFRFL